MSTTSNDMFIITKMSTEKHGSLRTKHIDTSIKRCNENLNGRLRKPKERKKGKVDRHATFVNTNKTHDTYIYKTKNKFKTSNNADPTKTRG